MTWPLPIRVVGVGSPMGDDALAWEAIRQLREWRELRPEIELIKVDGGQRILDSLDGRGTLILVDAISAGTSPGTIHRFEWPESRIKALRPGSTHDMQPAEALRLASALGIGPEHVVVFAMEIDSVAPLSGLSAAVTAAMPHLVRRLVDEVQAASLDEANVCDPIRE